MTPSSQRREPGNEAFFSQERTWERDIQLGSLVMMQSSQIKEPGNEARCRGGLVNAVMHPGIR